MRFSANIKVRVTVLYLFILMVALCFLSTISYFELANSLNDRIYSPLTPYHTQLKLESSAAISVDDMGQDFVQLTTYSIPQNQIDSIKTLDQSIININSMFGVLPMDQKAFVTDDVLGTQSVTIYGRISQTVSGMVEVVVVLQSSTAVSDIMHAFSQILYITTPVTLIIAGILGFTLIRRAFKPIEQITRAAQQLEPQNLIGRIPTGGNDELGQLSAILNQTLERIQEAFENERGLTAEASHGLKTPLAIIQGEATLALRRGRSRKEYEKSLVSISDEISRLSTTIDRLLNLERMGASAHPLDFKDLDVMSLLVDVSEDIRVLCEGKNIGFDFNTSNISEIISIKGDVNRLRELLLNLADNALKYTPAGGRITLFLESVDGFARIGMKDTGTGIHPAHLPHIFERFYHFDSHVSKNGNGVGLGLPICKKIAELHGGKIEAESRVGEGSTFTLIIPICR